MTDPVIGVPAVLLLAARWRWWIAPRWRWRRWRTGVDLIPWHRQVRQELPLLRQRRLRVVGGRLRLAVPRRPSDEVRRRLRHAAAGVWVVSR